MNIQNKLILGFWKREQRIQKNCYRKIMQIRLSQKVTNKESYGCWLVSVQRCHDRWTALDMFTSLLLVTAFLKLMQIRRYFRTRQSLNHATVIVLQNKSEQYLIQRFLKNGRSADATQWESDNLPPRPVLQRLRFLNHGAFDVWLQPAHSFRSGDVLV